MSILSWPVLGLALLVGSPALWAALVDGTLSPDVALIRLGLCVVGSWVALSVVSSLSEDALAASRRVEAEKLEAERLRQLEMQRPADVDLD
jgi:hypothetical protein